jgi:hypothetical protein
MRRLSSFPFASGQINKPADCLRLRIEKRPQPFLNKTGAVIPCAKSAATVSVANINAPCPFLNARGRKARRLALAGHFCFVIVARRNLEQGQGNYSAAEHSEDLIRLPVQRGI